MAKYFDGDKQSIISFNDFSKKMLWKTGPFTASGGISLKTNPSASGESLQVVGIVFKYLQLA
ncbi:MAG: hypothetical protein BGO52_15715 [Sphingobacteriales bacterium 44-61]|nr:MAG: hypothetical protein BGO52_15715 [Sphingobacteriales bacterium 44-61]